MLHIALTKFYNFPEVFKLQRICIFNLRLLYLFQTEPTYRKKIKNPDSPHRLTLMECYRVWL